MNDIINIVGHAVRHFRTAQNLSQEELADRAHVHSTHIGRIERGTINCTIEMLNKVITALDISFQDFFKQIQPSSKTDNEVFPILIAKLMELNKEEQACILDFVTNYKLTKKE